MYKTLHVVVLILQLVLLYGAVVSDKDFPTTETIETHSACFGTHTQFQASCVNTPGSVIGIKDVKVGAKPLSSGCPEEIRDNMNGLYYLNFTTIFNDLSCCMANYTSDCLFSYESTEYNYFKYYNICTGLQNCSTVLPVSRSPTDCNSSDYLNYTNYMLIEFACIQETRIFAIDTPVSKTVTGQALYLKTPSYPNLSLGGTVGECSLHTDSCGSTINMYTLDRRMNDVTGCLQSLTVSDGEQILGSWDSSLDPLFHVNKLEMSDNYVRVNYTQAAGVDCGVVWLGFEASDSASSLTLNCPAVDRPSCDVEAATGQSSAGGSDSTIYIIIGAVGALLLIALIAALCICSHKQWCCFRKNKVGPEDDDEKEAGNQDGLDSIYLQREATASAAPANTAFSGPLPLNPNSLFVSNDTRGEARPARLPPLQADNEDPKSTKKKKKKRIKFKKHDVEGDEVFLIESNGVTNTGETGEMSNQEKKKKRKRKKKDKKEKLESVQRFDESISSI